jgi:hypothetical protein
MKTLPALCLLLSLCASGQQLVFSDEELPTTTYFDGCNTITCKGHSCRSTHLNCGMPKGLSAKKKEDPSKPTVNEAPVMKKVYSCQKGWKLQTWHYGTDDMTQAVSAIYRSDPSGYQDVPVDSTEDLHPPRCVKDESAASKPDTRKSHAVATVPRKEKK